MKKRHALSKPFPMPLIGRFLPSRKQLLKAAAVAVVGALVLSPVLATAKTVVIDVRTPEEYQVNHPSGAINIPHSSIVNSIASKGVSKQDSIKLYSRSGNRADLAKNALQAAGYQDVQVQQ